ncbi:MAG: EamA family transporter [Bdellovibrio sp.]
MLTGISLLIGSLWGLLYLKEIHFDWKSQLIGVYGITGFHVFYFLGLRRASVFEANLINYLWPLLIVLLSPLILKKPIHFKTVFAVSVGFIGLLLALEIYNLNQFQFSLGHFFSLVAAFIWSSYSLLISRSKHSIGNNAITCLFSGIICLAMAYWFDEFNWPQSYEWPFIFAIGLFPLGASFYLWERGARELSSQKLGALSYLTPILSMIFLSIFKGQAPSSIFWIGFIIVLASGYAAHRLEKI